MSSVDVKYFRQRVVAERILASAAADARVAAVHDELARGYEALVRRDQMRLVPRLTIPDEERHTASA